MVLYAPAYGLEQGSDVLALITSTSSTFTDEGVRSNAQLSENQRVDGTLKKTRDPVEMSETERSQSCYAGIW